MSDYERCKMIDSQQERRASSLVDELREQLKAEQQAHNALKEKLKTIYREEGYCIACDTFNQGIPHYSGCWLKKAIRGED